LSFDGNEFCKEKNAAIVKVLMASVPQLKLLSLILWYRIFDLFGDHLASNADDILVNTTLHKHLTDVIHHLYLDRVRYIMLENSSIMLLSITQKNLVLCPKLYSKNIALCSPDFYCIQHVLITTV